jgi:DNA ligase (NAD+)
MFILKKGGEIIPKIVGVDKKNRSLFAEKIEFISHCPECKTELTRPEGEANHYCPNIENCPPQLKGKIEHFVSRKAMNIGLAEATIDQLFTEGLIKNIADLYTLTYDDLINLERFADKSAEKLIKSIQDSKNIPFQRVLFALGIRYVGETVAKKLAQATGSIYEIQKSSIQTLENIDEIGIKIAESVKAHFKIEANCEIVNKLKEAGVQLEISEEELASKTNKLEGLSIIISGSFSQYSRDEIKGMIEQNGGKNVSSISKKTSYLVAGEKIGPSKLAKAEKLEIKIISEDEFLELISDN